MDEAFRIQCEKDPALEEQSRLIQEKILKRKDEIMAARKKRGRDLRVRKKTQEEREGELDDTNPFD